MPYFTVFTSCCNLAPQKDSQVVQNNHRQYLGKAIQSALGQTFTDFEYLLVNDGSSDDTIDVMNQYADKDKRIKVFDLPKQLNVATVLNFSIQKMSFDSKYWIWLPSDDILYRTALEVRLKFSQEFPECVLYSDFHKISTEGTLSLKTQRDWHGREKHIVYKGAFPGIYSTGITIPVEAFAKAGLYPEHAGMCEDGRWIHNSVMCGVKYKKIPGVLHAKRLHPPNPRRAKELRRWRRIAMAFSRKLKAEAIAEAKAKAKKAKAKAKAKEARARSKSGKAAKAKAIRRRFGRLGNSVGRFRLPAAWSRFGWRRIHRPRRPGHPPRRLR